MSGTETRESETRTATERFVGAWNSFESTLGSDAWVHGLRKRAIARFDAEGVPTTKLEGWRYANLRDLVKNDYATLQVPAAKPSIQDLAGIGFGDLDAYTLTVVDGVFVPDLVSGHPGAPISAQSLAEALGEHRDQVEPFLDTNDAPDGEAFASLNTAFLRDGIFVQIPRGTTLNKPVHVRFVSTAAGSATHPRALVVCEENSEVTVLESFVGYGEADGYLCNSVTEFVVQQNARVKHIRLQNDRGGAHHLAALNVRQDRDSNFTSWVFSYGALLSRTAIRVRLAGEGSECSLNGLSLGRGKQHVDTFSVVEHVSPHATSDEVFKTILDDHASAAFNAKVVVHEGAAQSDAGQKNQNLLLSKNAVANTRPQLEIYNDDVKAAHGATVGQLDEAQVFYLRSRGIGEQEARRQLTYGFGREIIEQLPTQAAGISEVANRLEALMRAHFEKA